MRCGCPAWHHRRRGIRPGVSEPDAALHQRRFARWLAARGMRCEPFRFGRPAAGGETAAYLLHPGHPPRSLVVFVHGTGNDAWFPQINLFRRLLEAGHAVWTWDLDGHGRGSTTRLHPEAIRDAVRDAATRARAACPGVPLHLLGQSFGGSLVLRALAGGGLGPVAAAAVMSAPLHVRPTARTVAGELAGFASRACLSQRVHYGLWGTVPAFGRFKRAVYPIRLAQRERARSWEYVEVVNQALEGLGLPEAAEQIRTPTLLVYGARDWIVPLAQGRALHRHLPASEFQVLPTATHYTVPFEAATEQALLAWFARHP